MTEHPLIRWPVQGESRVPYRVFSEEQVYAQEQERIFRGNHWHFVALEVEVARAGDFKTVQVGDAPVVVSRDVDGEIYVFENRCAHRGALICLENGGNAKQFQCVYHAWSYDLKGNLTDRKSVV